MKPILPKTLKNESGSRQICNVLAAPGTTIILSSPIVQRGGLGELLLPSTATSTRNLQQQAQVILPIASTNYAQCPNLLPKFDNSIKICPKTIVRANPVSGFKQSHVKNILPKVSQPETKTLIIINPATSFVASAPSSSTPKAHKVVIRPKSAKCSAENNASLVISDRRSEISTSNIGRKPCAKDRSGIYNKIEAGARKRRTSRVVSKNVSRSKVVRANADTQVMKEVHDKSLNYVPSRNKTEISSSKACSDMSIKSDDVPAYMFDKNILYRPPPPYPCTSGNNSNMSLKVSENPENEESKRLLSPLLFEDSSTVKKNMNSLRARSPSVPPQFALFDSNSSLSCEMSSSYPTRNSPVPSETFSSKVFCSDNTSSSFVGDISSVPQQELTLDARHLSEDSLQHCSYGRTTDSPHSLYKSKISNHTFTKSTEHTTNPPSYNSSSQSVKCPPSVSSSQFSFTQLPYSDAMPSFTHALPSSHCSNITPQNSASTSEVAAASHLQLPSPSPQSGIDNNYKKSSLSKGIEPSLSPPFSYFEDTSTMQSSAHSLHGDPNPYGAKVESYPSSTDEVPLPCSSKGSYHISSQQSSPYTNSLSGTSYSLPPQMNTFNSNCSPHSQYGVSVPSTLYSMSPQPSVYTQSSQQTLYGPSQPLTTSSYSHQQMAYGQCPQEMSLSLALDHPNVRTNSQSSQSLQNHFSSPHPYKDSPHQSSYCQSPNDIGDLGKKCHSPLLPACSFPLLSASSNHVSNSPDLYADSPSHQSPAVHRKHNCDGDENLQSDYQSYCAEKFASASLPVERSLSPPSYESHLQNALSFSNTSSASTHAHSHTHNSHSQPPSTPENYPFYQHGRFSEQTISGVQMNPKDCYMEGPPPPPAYPSTSSSSDMPLPPPQYVTNPQSASAHQLDYPFTPDICSESQDYSSPLEHSGHFFPNTPPMLPLPAAPPPVDEENQFCPPTTNTTHGLTNTQSASYSNSFLNSTLYENHNFDEFRPFRDQGQHHIQSFDPHVESWKTGNGENSKVHDLIEKAEKLWFIPHQEQNRVYMKRKELAKDILNHSASKSKRDVVLKEKFWIEEDEPISREIVNAVCTDTPEQLFEDEMVSDCESYMQEVTAFVASSTDKKETNVMKNILCQVCGKILKNRSSFKSHMNSHLKPKRCPLCSRHFATRSSLVQHMRVHSGEKPYMCTICDEPFRTRVGLLRHKSKHTNARPYECSKCSKTFKTKIVLHKHLKLHLTGGFTCPECKKTFERYKSYVVHKASHHQSAKRYRCTLCPKQYRFQSLLNYHMQMHENIQRFRCHVCGKQFVWRSGLSAHLKTHSDSRPKCSKCGAQFVSQKRLETHFRRHGNKKPHCCEECGHRFAHAYRLAAHRMVHQRRRGYSCPKCSLNFNSKKKFDKHLTSHNDGGADGQCSGSVT